MAVLAAYDIADLNPWCSLQVYTVGAPRPGNRAFAEHYNAKVPHTWHVINPKARACPLAAMHVHPGVEHTCNVIIAWQYARRSSSIGLLNVHLLPVEQASSCRCTASPLD